MERTVSVDLDDATLNVTYESDAFAGAYMNAAVRDFTADPDERAPVLIQVIADQLAAVIVGWDLTEDDGRPMPPTRANVARLPVLVVARILRAIEEDYASTSGDG